jgi:DNA mismatch repair protein MutL
VIEVPIRVLPPEVANLIRAGEAIARPAQVAKELIENAIDAGATDIRVTLRDGGRSLVEVIDNGCGMSPEDLLLCVRRHATSKLDTGDIRDVSTLGFRGEALAAIGAVTHMVVSSRQRGAEHGWQVAVDNGAEAPLRPCGGAAGTRVEARDLFRAHPARAAFLGEARYEAALAKAAFADLALSRPGVAFRLDGGRKPLALPAASWEARVMAVMGRDFAENSLSFRGASGGLEVAGYVGLPTWGGHAAAGQHVLVNGRPVKDRTVSAALKAAFARVSKETAPAAVVALTLPPGSVDINVSPTKSEVRHKDAGAVSALVRGAVEAAVGGGGPRAAAAVSKLAEAAARAVAPGDLADGRRRPLGAALGMAAGRYVVSATHDGIVVTDLHAIHERHVFEQIRASARSLVPPRPLPAPVRVAVGEDAAALVAAKAGALSRLGLVLSVPEGGEVVVEAVPGALSDVDAAGLARDVAARLRDDPFSDPVGDRLDEMAALIACHAAFRGGDHLDAAALDAMLREIEGTPNAAQCMHGRPTSVALDKDSLDRIFGRS